MIQDIEPHVYDNAYFTDKFATDDDHIIIFGENGILLEEVDSEVSLPTLGDIRDHCPGILDCCRYLFRLDTRDYFLARDAEIGEFGTYRYFDTQAYRYLSPMWKAFACSVAEQLSRWYSNNRFCGRCGAKTADHERERALICAKCGKTVYPTIMPAVIVGVTDGDRLLMIRNNYGLYRRYALVAGFAEIGESLEQTVYREVLEEVGIAVKNIRYYKSQPWPFSDSLLVGYFCEADSGEPLSIQEEELAEAVWFDRDDIPPTEATISLTSEMIELFRSGRHRG